MYECRIPDRIAFWYPASKVPLSNDFLLIGARIGFDAKKNGERLFREKRER
jgi:hypothetical protein